MKLFTQALRIIGSAGVIAVKCHIYLVALSSCLLKIIITARGLNLTMVIIFTVVSSGATRFLIVNE